jgi:hypothetical protein
MSAAEKVTNPFKFSAGADFKAKASNAYTAATVSSTDATTNTWDTQKIGDAYLEFTPSAGMSTTIAQIYALSFNFSGRLRQYDNTAKKNEVRFMFGWGNKITVVKDYLDINVDLSYNIDNNAAYKEGSWYEPNREEALPALYKKGKTVTSLVPTGTIGLGGKVGKTGFKWGLSETATLQLNANAFKDVNPTAIGGKTKGGENWHPYGVTNGIISAATNGDTVIGATDLYGCNDTQTDNLVSLIDSFALTTALDLQFEFFHFFAPENITCTIKFPSKFGLFMPYSSYYEISKEFTWDTTPGLDFDFAGIKLFVGARSRLQAYYNTSSPLDGTNGSCWSHDGKAVLDAGGNLANWVNYTAMEQNFSPDHHQSWWRGGPQVKFTIGKDWLSFTMDWQGYGYAGAALYDNDNKDSGGKNAGGGAGSGWKNEFNVAATIKL